MGKIQLPKVDCIFFSGHKMGAPFGTGAILCSNYFADNYL